MSAISWQTIKDSKDAPTTCGVYEYWSKDTLLYIGKAINIKARLASHAQNAKLDAKEAAIVAGTDIRYTLCDSEFKALLLESELIRQLHPPHNRVWKDDKSYLYILIDMADHFPRPRFARAHDLELQQVTMHNNKLLHVFGPFPSAKIAEEVLRAIRRLIPFCMAKKVRKPGSPRGGHACFYSRIGLCNPCPSVISSKVEKSQYRTQIRHVIRILEGDINPVIKELTKEMQVASQQEDFETALQIRTKIERFERFITTHSFTTRLDSPGEAGHHFSYNNSAEKLISLASILDSYYKDRPRKIHRIECYDASNNGTKDSVVSLTVMTDGLLDKGQYRRFKIKNPRAVSDFDRLDEALIRRLKNKTWDRPDLIVIDGGVPQLRRLQRIFDQQANPPLYLGLAKHPDRLVIPVVRGLIPRNPDQVSNNIQEKYKGSTLAFETIKVPGDHPGLQLLQQIRDEAHRFANAYRKILESKKGAPRWT